MTYNVLRKLQFELTHQICASIRTEIRASLEIALKKRKKERKKMSRAAFVSSFLSLTQLFQEFIKVFGTLHIPGAGEIGDFALHFRLQVVWRIVAAVPARRASKVLQLPRVSLVWVCVGAPGGLTLRCPVTAALPR